ncbi:phospholipase D family protein [Candidatus Profftella armatura]|uniref:phospholipase D n=1 Tax=Candidatus Profftella armatura TaxID=669502 RepID=S5R4B4_9PROT|nr:phospholipase D family protein [Candidatus Profftella armatura]AGS07044.1 hypothetical protein SSDC_01800 [Candidatus Profftella armatura]
MSILKKKIKNLTSSNKIIKKITIILLIFFLTLPIFSNSNFFNHNNNIEVGFSPGNAKKIVLNAIQEAKKSIEIAAYSFTNKDIAKILVKSYKKGINIRIIADKKANSGKYTAVTYLANNNIPIRLNNNYAIMHNKFIIIDHKSVETGSLNYTQNAMNRNAENVIYFRNKPNVSEKFLLEFDRLWSESKNLNPKY